jgi:hypothetical protein
MLLFLLVSEATMPAHAFEVLSRARNEIEVCHTAEGHRLNAAADLRERVTN